MSQHLSPEPLTAPEPEQDTLRALSRSPHPYHHRRRELPYASDRFDASNGAATLRSRAPTDDATNFAPTALSPYLKESSPGSESGTEADDEHFLKGLPAPKWKPRKGLRGRNEPLSGSSTPPASPAIWEEERTSCDAKEREPSKPSKSERRQAIDVLRRHKNLCQRATEAAILVALGLMVRANPQVAPLLDIWERGNNIPQLSITEHVLTRHRLPATGPPLRRTSGNLSTASNCMGISKETALVDYPPQDPFQLRSSAIIIPISYHRLLFTPRRHKQPRRDPTQHYPQHLFLAPAAHPQI